MIISSEHHDLLEQFKAANEAEGETIRILAQYLSIPGYDVNVADNLSRSMEEAHNKTMTIYNQLHKVRLDR